MKISHVILLSFCSLSLYSMCQKSETRPKQTTKNQYKTVPLNTIPDDPRYLQLSLQNGWRFVGYANDSTQQIELVSEAYKNRYGIGFSQDTIYISTQRNSLYASYHADSLTKTISMGVIGGTKAKDDSPEFMMCMYRMFKYNITAKGLCLYYSENEYLLLNIIFR